MKPRSEERHEDSFLAVAAGAQVLAGARHPGLHAPS